MALRGLSLASTALDLVFYAKGAKLVSLGQRLKTYLRTTTAVRDSGFSHFVIIRDKDACAGVVALP